MIWIGYAGFSLIFLLLALHTLRKARANERILDDLKKSAITLFYKHPQKDPLELFEGPARLELFGHVTHVGWVRQGPERIDLLTIEGEAIQCDTRARYRLTPLSWQQLSEAAAEARERLERVRELGRLGAAAEDKREAAEARAAGFEERLGLLQHAVEKAIMDLRDPEKAAHVCGRGEIVRELEEAFNADDGIPF